jgi:acyl-coenzyme A synthetase/AMP-(fatty) acid ligase/acyl carrier protein
LWEIGVTTRLSHYNPEDRFAFVVPYTFGASIVNIFALLLNGGSVITFDLRDQGLQKLATWIREEKITIFYSVPTVFRHWMNVLEKEAFYPSMRLIKLGGEPLIKRDLELFKHHFSADCRLRIALGTTENYLLTCLIVDREYQPESAVLPVGYPIEGKQLLILDEDLKPVAPGEIGQIAVRSQFLSPGYWRRPDLTRSTYLPDPDRGDKRVYLTGDLGRVRPDGCLEHLGRLDDMVKIRGNRVELAELEMTLLELDRNLREVAVSAYKDAQGENRLVAYLVPIRRESLDIQVLRKKLHDLLPDHFVPATFVILEHLPLLPIGKVNRSALPAPIWKNHNGEREFVLPRTPIEHAILEIWMSVISKDADADNPPFGITDKFLDLGGDSLQAVEIGARIREEFSIGIPANLLYEKGTVVEIAAYVDHALKNRAGVDLKDEELQRALHLLGDV